MLLRIWVSIGLTAIVFAVPQVQAEESATGTMATIMINLKHFPSDADKAALNAIADDADATDAEKVVAKAIAAIQHKVTDEDGMKLNAIIADDDAAESTRNLARIVASVMHVPSAESVQSLKAIAGN